VCARKTPELKNLEECRSQHSAAASLPALNTHCQAQDNSTQLLANLCTLLHTPDLMKQFLLMRLCKEEKEQEGEGFSPILVVICPFFPPFCFLHFLHLVQLAIWEKNGNQ